LAWLGLALAAATVLPFASEFRSMQQHQEKEAATKNGTGA
jgi:hypothetical protein